MQSQPTPPLAPEVKIPWWQRLRWHLAFLAMVLVFFTVAAVLAVTFSRVRTMVENQVSRQLETTAELKHQEMVAWTDWSQRALSLLDTGTSEQSRYVIVTDPNLISHSAMQRTLNDMFSDAVETYPLFAEIFYYDAAGEVLASSDTSRVSVNVQDEPYYQPSLASTYRSPVFHDPELDALSLIVTHPVFRDPENHDELVGVLAGRLDLGLIQLLMRTRIGLGETGETYLVRPGNELLTSSRTEGIGPGSTVHSFGIDQALAGKNGSSIYENYNGDKVIGVYRWLPKLQAALLAEQHFDEALAAHRETRTAVTYVTLSLALLAAIFGALVAARITRPLTALSDIAQRLASGDLEVEVPPLGIGEVKQLSLTFRAMAARLRDLVDMLEARVAARTRDVFLTLGVGQMATSTLQQEQLLPRLVEYIREQFDLYYVQIYLVDDVGRYAILAAGTGEIGQQLAEYEHRLDLRETSIVARAVHTHTSVLVEDTAESDTHLPNPLLPETRSEVAVPLLVENRVIGVLDLQANRAGTFHMDNLPVFEAMANYIASAVLSARTYREMQEATAHAEALSRRLTGETWERYLSRLAEGGSVGYQYDLSKVEPITPDSSPEGDAETSSGDDFDAHLRQEITLRGQVIGTIQVQKDDEPGWERENQHLLESVARRIALTLEQFRAFDETRAALERLDLILRTTEAGFFGLDRDGNVTFVNPAAERMIGFTAEEMRGKMHHQLVHHTRQDGSPYPQDECPVHASLHDGIPRTVDGELFWRKDGSSFPVTLSVSPFKRGDDIIGAVISFQDITERRRAEAERERLLEETRQLAAEMQTVAEVGAEIASSLDVENLLWDVSNIVKDRFGLYHAHIYLLDEEGSYLNLAAGAGEAGKRMVAQRHRISLEHPRSLVARAAREATIVVEDDVTQAEDFLPNPLLPRTRSEMAVPLVVGGRMLGVMDVQADRRGFFTEQEQRVLSVLGAQIAIAVNNARLFTEREMYLRQTQALYETGRALVAASDYAGVLRAASEYPFSTGVSGSTLQIFEREEEGEPQEIVIVAAMAAENSPLRQAKPGQRFPVGKPSLGYSLFSQSEAIFVSDVGRDEQLNETAYDMLEAAGVAATVLVPLHMADRAVGFMSFNWAEPHEFTDEERHYYRAIAPQVAAVVETRRLLEAVEKALVETATLYNISRRIVTATDEQELLAAVFDALNMEALNRALL